MTERKVLTPAQIAFKKEFDCYNKLHDFFSQEHGLILTTGEMDDILKACDEFKKEWNDGVKDSLPY